MNIQNIFLVCGLLFCLIAAFVVFGIMARRRIPVLTPGLTLFLPPLVCAGVYAGAAWNGYDFISTISPFKFLALLLAATPIAVLSSKLNNIYIRALLMFACSAGVLICFNFQLPSIITLPSLAGQLLAALLWTIFALSLRLINGQPALAAIQTTGTGLGILLLYFIGAVPFALGFTAGCLAAAAAAFLVYNWYPPVLELKNSDVDTLGFFLGGLLILCSLEGCIAPAFTLILYPVCETVFALLQKLTFLPRYADMQENTSYSKAAALGLNPKIIASHILRLNLLLILFCCFETYAPNQFSLPLIFAVITIWQMYRLANWNTLSSGIKETNQNILKELKKNFSALKNNQNTNSTNEPD